MQNRFFEKPILNSPYDYPTQYWELDADGQPTHNIMKGRRTAEFITPIPKPKLTKKKAPPAQQERLDLDGSRGLSDGGQEYDVSASVNQIRGLVDNWRRLPPSNDWGVTPETKRLLQHWRDHRFSSYRPFFCQVEAIETLIWLTEVAPGDERGKSILRRLQNVNKAANPDLLRIALKLATGAGKTTVMAMIIAWQTVNAVRRPGSERFTKGFLVVAPGITIRDRLRVLQPNDPDSYYSSRELVPADMQNDLKQAKIVITNYHAFMLRERMQLSKVGRGLLAGRNGSLRTQETEGQMLQRVMPDLMNMKKILVMNDEGHHCYRRKPDEEDEEGKLTGEDRQEAKKNNDAARVWITGLETIKRKIGISKVIDLSATPFFLRGSGYREGTLFPWTVSDFSLMDAIECGIVKLPRVPVADNIPDGDAPKFRVLWEQIRPDMPKKGRGNTAGLDPLKLPVQLQTALEALYGHYEKTFKSWQEAKIPVPPCFVIVCNNTSTSKLVYDYVSGFHREELDGSTSFEQGRLGLFRNFDEHGNRLARPNTVLIDSRQLESGEALDANFRKMAAQEIEQFRREIIDRTGDRSQADNFSEQDLLREVMNTVGKEGRLGGSVRCVVSVSMLTEGWDANTVTHILGVRAFGTQLLCEQVVGRALRRQSYELNEEQLFDAEYADVLGVPFDFTARPVVVPPPTPKQTVQVMAMRPERDHLEIRFPRVAGYRVDLPKERLAAEFTEDSVLELTPGLIGPSHTTNAAIIGQSVDLNLVHTNDLRPSTLVYELASHLAYSKWRDDVETPASLFGWLRPITRKWLKDCLLCKGGTYPAQLMFVPLAEMACDRIADAITRTNLERNTVRALLDPYNPAGSTRFVNFHTSKASRWDTDPGKCHVNWAILDSTWEGEFCRVAEGHARVRAYVKNHNLGLNVPYKHGAENRLYIPDFIVQVDDGRGEDDLLNLIVEIKGHRGEDAKEKKSTMETYWVPGVNNAGEFGRWDFVEFTDVNEIDEGFDKLISQAAAKQD